MNNHCSEHDVPHLVRESGSINGGYINWGCVVCVSLKRDTAQNALREISNGARKFLADTARLAERRVESCARETKTRRRVSYSITSY